MRSWLIWNSRRSVLTRMSSEMPVVTVYAFPFQQETVAAPASPAPPRNTFEVTSPIAGEGSTCWELVVNALILCTPGTTGQSSPQ